MTNFNAPIMSETIDSSLYTSFMRFAADEFDSISLSKREMEVATLAIHGLSNPAIGQRLELKVSEKQSRSATVRSTLERIYEKVNMPVGRMRTEAVAARLLERHAAVLLGHTALGPLIEDNTTSISPDVRQEIEQIRIDSMTASGLDEIHIEIVRQFGKRLTSKEIGNKLHRSEDGIKTSLTRAYKLAQVKNRFGLLAWSYGIRLMPGHVRSNSLFY